MKIVVTGGNGFLGKHLVKRLEAQGHTVFVPRSNDYDLRYVENIDRMFRHVGGGIDRIYNLAANVGGIGYNQKHPYTLFYDNAMIGVNLINESINHGVQKFIQVGTVCAYPKWTKTPFIEKALWDGYPEETNAPYGIAKKILLVQLQAARDEFGFNGVYILPTNLYGPGDNFNPESSHVIPALIKKCVDAKSANEPEVEVWGTGKATRDFLYVDDCVDGLMLAAEKYNRPEPLNLGNGEGISILVLVDKIMKAVGYKGKIRWDTSKPDGQPKRRLDIKQAKHALKWEPKTNFDTGLKNTVEWYLQNA